MKHPLVESMKSEKLSETDNNLRITIELESLAWQHARKWLFSRHFNINSERITMKLEFLVNNSGTQAFDYIISLYESWMTQIIGRFYRLDRHRRAIERSEGCELLRIKMDDKERNVTTIMIRTQTNAINKMMQVRNEYIRLRCHEFAIN